MLQTITFKLDQTLVGKLRSLAATRAMSVSSLLRNEITRLVEEHERFESARRSAIADLEQGFDLGGQPATRDELHEREALR